MRKFGVFVVILAVGLFLSCENLITALPETDTHSFVSDNNTVIFPRGTRAIDIYNTVVSVFQGGEYHDVTDGGWQRIRTATVNGLPVQEWETVAFNRIKHSHSVREPDVNTHTVYLYRDDTLTRRIVFQWQRQTTNVWQNEAIQGEIVFTF